MVLSLSSPWYYSVIINNIATLVTWAVSGSMYFYYFYYLYISLAFLLLLFGYMKQCVFSNIIIFLFFK